MQPCANRFAPCQAVPQTTFSTRMNQSVDDYLVCSDPRDPRLTERVRGIDQSGASIETDVVEE
jgi:hypothetical protein